MSITASQIFVKTERTGRLLKALEGYLARWAKSVRDDWPDVPFLGTDTARSTFVLPPVEGWCCVLDPDPYAVDLDLAQLLSAKLGTVAVAVQLRGGELSWRYAAFERGASVREEAEPIEAFEPGAGAGEIPMPVYPDAVREAIRVLRSEGVPKDYWLLSQDDLAAEEAELDGTISVDVVAAHPEKGRPVERRRRGTYRLRHERGRVNFRPDVTGSTPDHRPLLVEIRTLFGHPGHQAVANLLEIERADRNRVLDPYLERSAAELPSVYFEYSSRGSSEEELTKTLDLRRLDFFRARPPKTEFLERALELVRSERPEWRDPARSGFGLRFELAASGGEESIDLERTYEDFMEGRLAPHDTDEALRHFLGRAAADIERSASKRDFKSVAEALMPCLVGEEEAARLAADGVASKPLGHGVTIAIVVPVGEGSAVIDSKDLARWGLSFDDALAAARSNLRRRAVEEVRGFLPTEIAPGRKAQAMLSGPMPATHILLPGLGAVLGDLLRTQEVYCAIPDQDSFFAVDATDRDATSALKAFARERLLVAERPLTADLFHVKAEQDGGA